MNDPFSSQASSHPEQTSSHPEQTSSHPDQTSSRPEQTSSGSRGGTGGMTPADVASTVSEIRAELGKVIVGQTGLVKSVLLALLAEGHVLLEGVPGLGKTMLLRTLADAMDMPWSRIQFTPDLMPADITGTQVLHQDPDGSRSFKFQSGPINANLVLADEVNRATPKTQSAMLEAMQERAVTVAGETRPLPRPFLVMATQNPVEMDGTYPLPEAQLDRFLMKVLVPFPSAEELMGIVDRTTGAHTATASAVCNASTLQSMIALTRQVPVPEHVTRFAVDLVVASHPDQSTAPSDVRSYVRFGASPRGVQSLILAGKANALTEGRPNVSIDDIKSVATAALRHRLVLGYEATADGVSGDSLVASVLSAVVPAGSGVRGAP